MHGAIEHVRAGKHDPHAYHTAVASMYSWSDVAARVEHVYRSAHSKPYPSFYERLIK